MSRGYPSMTALLGLLAVAGYQNRDKIAEWLNAAQRKAGTLAQTSDAQRGRWPPGKLEWNTSRDQSGRPAERRASRSGEYFQTGRTW